MNKLTDAINTYLLTKHARVYRNKAPQNPTYPYVVFIAENATDTEPSLDVMLNIYIFDQVGVSIRTIDTLADSIDAGLRNTVISNSDINAHFTRDSRSFDKDDSESGVQVISLQYTVRTYFKS